MFRPAIFRTALALCCAVALWAMAVNRVILNYPTSPQKTLATFLLAGLLAAVALYPSWSVPQRRSLVWPWLALAVLLGVGELRRLWLRNDYRVESPRAASLFTPVTTTELRVTRFTLRVAGLPVERVRFAHLTDLHATEAQPQSYRERVMDELRALDPDVIVLTGDYVSTARRLPLLADWLKGLPRALR